MARLARGDTWTRNASRSCTPDNDCSPAAGYPAAVGFRASRHGVSPAGKPEVHPPFQADSKRMPSYFALHLFYSSPSEKPEHRISYAPEIRERTRNQAKSGTPEIRDTQFWFAVTRDREIGGKSGTPAILFGTQIAYVCFVIRRTGLRRQEPRHPFSEDHPPGWRRSLAEAVSELPVQPADGIEQQFPTYVVCAWPGNTPTVVHNTI